MLQGSQRTAGLIAIVFVLSGTVTTGAMATAVRSSASFTVLAPTARLADKVVDRAEVFRSRISVVWLGESLPAARTPATIFVEIDDAKSFARTLVDPVGGRHLVWLVGSEEAVTKYLLAHELVHVTLAARFGDSLPLWANEGIASRYDNANRSKIRQQELAGFVQIDSWPQLDRLFSNDIRQQWEYAAAVSVTNYLVERGGREKFLAFVADSVGNTDAALQLHYGIPSVSQLQKDWQRAVQALVQDGKATAAMATVPVPSSRYVR